MFYSRSVIISLWGQLFRSTWKGLSQNLNIHFEICWLSKFLWNNSSLLYYVYELRCSYAILTPRKSGNARKRENRKADQTRRVTPAALLTYSRTGCTSRAHISHRWYFLHTSRPPRAVRSVSVECHFSVVV